MLFMQDCILLPIYYQCIHKQNQYPSTFIAYHIIKISFIDSFILTHIACLNKLWLKMLMVCTMHGFRNNYYKNYLQYIFTLQSIYYVILLDMFSYIWLLKRWLHSWVEISQLFMNNTFEFVTHPVLIKASLSRLIYIPHYAYQKIETVECGCA